MPSGEYSIIVVGGGHAGVEAAWAAANLLAAEPGLKLALVTLDPARIGEMSCNPAIGGLAKGQLVREVDAMGGLMGLAADATGIMFKTLNMSRGAAVRGPRCQSDKHAYAEFVRALIAARREIDVIAGSVEQLITETVGTERRIVGVGVRTAQGEQRRLESRAVVLTTGTFMRGLMHTGERKTPGGRFGEGSAVGISGALQELGFELGRLKTGTPPRIKRSSIDWDGLEVQEGDPSPTPFSDLTGSGGLILPSPANMVAWETSSFPRLEQVSCRQTRTTPECHELVRQNLHRAPMYSGQIKGTGPRYCPSLEDKVVRFAERESHGVFLEPESLRTDWIYCNGISTSLPTDVQDEIVHRMPGCERAEIYRYGYAVEYDMVRPHQIFATGMTKLVAGLFLAGQINGTSGYEEAAAQGLVAGINAIRYVRGQGPFTLGREQAYIGVLMDDLVTKTPREPYRMFTSRAEHRLMLRSDNAADRLTPVAREQGLLASTTLGRRRIELFTQRSDAMTRVRAALRTLHIDDEPAETAMRGPEFSAADLAAALAPERHDPAVLETIVAETRYRPYIEREQRQVRRQSEIEHKSIPATMNWSACRTLRNEARDALHRFRPATFGQASRLEGVTPADLTLMAVLVQQAGGARKGSA